MSVPLIEAPFGATPVYRLRVTLEGVEPPVWRLLEVPGTLTLADLHRVLQVVMGWEDYHLFSFEVGGVEYGLPDPDGFLEFEDAREVPLEHVIRGKGQNIVYEYDFGDSWMHAVRVEAVTRAAPGGPTPPVRVLDGVRACPPEDAGGPYGYRDLLEALADVEHEEHAAVREWAGAGFDPEAWDRGATQRRLDRLMSGEDDELPEDVEDLLDELCSEMAEAAAKDARLANLVLAGAIRLLETYARENPLPLMRSRKPEIWAAAALHASSLVLVGHGQGHPTVEELAGHFGVGADSVAARSLQLRERVEPLELLDALGGPDADFTLPGEGERPSSADLDLPGMIALVGNVLTRIVPERAAEHPELGGRTDAEAVLEAARNRGGFEAPLDLAELSERFGLSAAEAGALEAALERAVRARDTEEAARWGGKAPDHSRPPPLEERLEDSFLLGHAACAALRSPGLPAAARDALARHLLGTLAHAFPPPGALLGVARLASGEAVTPAVLRAAVRLAATSSASCEGLEPEELRPLWRGLTRDEAPWEEEGEGEREGERDPPTESELEAGRDRFSQSDPEAKSGVGTPTELGVEALRLLIAAAAAGRSPRSFAPAVASLALTDPDVPAATRAEVARRMIATDAMLPNARPLTPALRREALVAHARLAGQPASQVGPLLARALEDQDLVAGTAAARLLAEHGADLPRGEVEALVRAGMAAWRAEIRDAFFRAGIKHLGGDAREWLPVELHSRAGEATEPRTSDGAQTSLF